MRSVWAAAVLACFGASACLDEPTFVQVDGGADGGTSSSSGSGGSSSGGPTPTSTGTATPPNAKCDARACSGAGGTCEGSTCAFRCPAAAPATPAQMLACAGEVVCPPGIDCLVACSAKNACKKISCNEPNNDCNITCAGDTACNDQIVAASSNAVVSCNGNNACPKVDCEGAKCAVACGGSACNPMNVKCCAKTCTVNNAAGSCKN